MNIKTQRKMISFIILILTCSLLSSCHQDTPTIDSLSGITMNVDSVTLTDIWETISQESDLKENTAKLHSFSLVTDQAGEIQRILIIFWGFNSNDKPTSYIANIEGNNLVINTAKDTIYSHESHHPENYFTELDKYGLDRIQSKTEGITLSIESMYSGGDYKSDSDLNQLFMLTDGNLTPITRIMFCEKPYIMGIKIGRKASENQNRYLLEYWFLLQDLANAQIVEFTNNS